MVPGHTLFDLCSNLNPTLALREWPTEIFLVKLAFDKLSKIYSIFLFKVSSSNMIQTSYENMSNCVVVCFVGSRRCNLIEHTPLTLIMSSLYQEK